MNALAPLVPALSDRWYQEEAVDALFEYFYARRNRAGRSPIPANPLVVMPTGTGKSVVIAVPSARLRSLPQRRA
jgi:superfamily II DNA or RNA helicase